MGISTHIDTTPLDFTIRMNGLVDERHSTNVANDADTGSKRSSKR